MLVLVEKDHNLMGLKEFWILPSRQ